MVCKHPDSKGLNQTQQKKIQLNNSGAKTIQALTIWVEQKCSATETLSSVDDSNSSGIQNWIFVFFFPTTYSPSISSSSELSQKCSAPFL